MANQPPDRLKTVFNCEDPHRAAWRSLATGLIAFAVSNLALRTFFAALTLAFTDPLYATETFSEKMADPFGWGTHTFAAASVFGAVGGAVSYIRDQNAKEWATGNLRTFTGHMVIAQFAAVMAYLLANLAGWDGYWLIVATGVAGYLGDKALDRIEPLFEALVNVLVSKKGPTP